MRQQTYATGEFECNRKPTRREQFMTELDQVVPCNQLCSLIGPSYPQAGNGHPLVSLERMLFGGGHARLCS